MFSNQEYSRGHGHGPHERHSRGERGRSFGFGERGEFGGFRPGGPWGGGRGPRGRGRKARRGDIRTAALLLLAEEPRNGYQIMQEVQERSGGVWSPSPGSVYPALAQLEDEGLIRSQESDGRKLFAITDAGTELLSKRPADQPAPWDEASESLSQGAHELGRLMKETAYAFAQVMRTGSETQIASAREVLARTRKDLYRILAEDEGETGGDAGTV